jgi:hypothetical protein
MVFPDLTEHSIAIAQEHSMSGIFIGCTEKTGMPFFLNPKDLINPHIFVAGMSGSGKTYLTKNLMIKLYAVLGNQIILIDFTGEYADFSEFAGCTRYDFSGISKVLVKKEPGILYIGLGGMRDKEKISAAINVVEEIAGFMRKRTSGKNRMLYVILDEAWKLLSLDKSFAALIREGRKYGTGIIITSQLIEDLEAGMLSNIATLFIFRIQREASLRRLETDYQLSSAYTHKVQTFGIGECLVMQLGKSGRRDAFFISGVVGLSVGTIIKVKGGVVVELEYRRLEEIITKLTKSDSSELLRKLNSEKAIGLDELIEQLIRLGANKHDILDEMRVAGFKNDDLADAFAIALNKVSFDGK